MAVGVSSLSLLLAFFIAVDTSEVYPPELRASFAENALVGQTFTEQLPADAAMVFMTGNFGVCKSKKGIVIPFSELASFLKKAAAAKAGPTDELVMLDGMENTVRSFLRMFHGEVGIALLNFPAGRRPPDFIVRADVDESEISFTDMARRIGHISSIAAESFLSEEDGFLVIRKKLYVKITDKKLYASNSRRIIEQFLSGTWKKNPLSGSALYREVAKQVEFNQEQFLFVNVEQIWQEVTAARGPTAGERRAVAADLFGNVRAIAGSTRLSGGSLNILSTVLFKDLTSGIPKILARPNASSEAATFVPPGYSLLVRAHTGPPLGLLKDVMALHEAVARSIQRGFPRIEDELGFGIEQDLLAALAGDFAIAARVPPMVGLPQSLAIVRIADRDKAAFVVESIVRKTKLAGFDEEYKGAKLQVVPLPLVSLTYVFVEDHLIIASSPQVAKAAIDARLSGKNLAASQEYRSAFEGHPSESFATVYADAQEIFNGLLNIGGGLVMWKGGDEGRELTIPLIALLRRNVKDLAPVSCSIYRAGNAIKLKTNSRVCAAGPASLLLPVWLAGTARAPDRARRVAAKAQISFFVHALELFEIDTGSYPSEEEGLNALVEKPTDADVAAKWSGPYVRNLPKDPWGRDYIYRRPGAGGADFDIICYGKDGVEGGEGVNKDITNHNLDER